MRSAVTPLLENNGFIVMEKGTHLIAEQQGEKWKEWRQG